MFRTKSTLRLLSSAFLTDSRTSRSDFLPDGQWIRLRRRRTNSHEWLFQQIIYIEVVYRPRISFPMVLLALATRFFHRWALPRVHAVIKSLTTFGCHTLADSLPRFCGNFKFKTQGWGHVIAMKPQKSRKCWKHVTLWVLFIFQMKFELPSEAMPASFSLLI